MTSILAYTTSIHPSKTAAEIQKVLVAAGARQVLTEFDDDGAMIGLSFAIGTATGMQRFRLPINAEAVQTVLIRDGVAPKYRTIEQAERVSWRIILAWLKAQLALLDAEMANLDQILLPYMIGPAGDTVYEMYLDQQLALGQGETE